MKRCRGCGVAKPVSDYHRDSSMRDGLAGKCKACKAELGRQYRAAHPEKRQANSRKWYLANRGEVLRRKRERLAAESDTEREARQAKGREWCRRYYARNRERIIATMMARPGYQEYARRYRAAHRKEAAERTRQWVRDNPERTRENRAARRARLANAPVVEKVDRAAVIARDRSICHICRKKVAKKDMTLDHLVPLSKGGDHTALNLAVAHHTCNSRRGAGALPAQLRLIA